MKTKRYTCPVIMIMALMIVVTASAGQLADSVFDEATVSLYANKTAYFSASTINVASSIQVTGVKLYKMIGNTWQYIQDLPVPSDVATNDVFFSASYDYSSYIGTGEYRLKVTFNADGHGITRYSNSRTF